MPSDEVEISMSVKDLDEAMRVMVSVAIVADELESGEISTTDAVAKLREAVATWVSTDEA